MRIALAALMVLVMLAAIHYYMEPADNAELPSRDIMTACKMNKECTVVRTPCGTPQAVNLVYEEALAKKYQEMREKDDCMWHDTRQVRALYCLDNNCRADLTKEKKKSAL